MVICAHGPDETTRRISELENVLRELRCHESEMAEIEPWRQELADV